MPVGLPLITAGERAEGVTRYTVYYVYVGCYDLGRYYEFSVKTIQWGKATMALIKSLPVFYRGMSNFMLCNLKYFEVYSILALFAALFNGIYRFISVVKKQVQNL